MSCLETLKKQGYRLTPQRVAVIEAVQKAEGHISAEEIYARVRGRYPDVNISTVYRTLELLRKLRLATETDLGEGILRYHHADEGHHHHLVCQECGRIIDLDEAALDSLNGVLMRKYGFVPDFKHLAIFGRCLNCQE